MPPKDAASKVSRICVAIRSAILEQALLPGDKLPEDALGERFGVSRTIARQALAQLSTEGLVDLRRNRISVVATPTLDEARDTYDIRIELEQLVVGHLAGRLTPDQVRELEAHVAAQVAAADSPRGRSIRLATEFHILLARMSAKPILMHYVSETAYRSGLSLSTFGRPHSSDCAVEEHRNLIAALEAGDADEARRLMSGHLRAVAARALLSDGEERSRDLVEILAPYVDGE